MHAVLPTRTLITQLTLPNSTTNDPDQELLNQWLLAHCNLKNVCLEKSAPALLLKTKFSSRHLQSVMHLQLGSVRIHPDTIQQNQILRWSCS